MRPTLWLAALLLTLPAAAQSRNFLLEETSILPTSAGQYEPAQHNYCSSIVPTSAPVCLVFSTALFGDPARYVTLIPFASFSHFDQGKYAPNGITVEEAHSLNQPPAVSSTRTSAITLERELSFTHAANDTLPLNLFLEYRLRPGSLDTFLALVRGTLLPAARKAAVPAFEVFHTLAGAGEERVLLVYRLTVFADLDHIHPFVGDGSAWQDFLSRFVLSSDSYLLRYRPDLSANPTDPGQ